MAKPSTLEASQAFMRYAELSHKLADAKAKHHWWLVKELREERRRSCSIVARFIGIPFPEVE